MIRHQLRRGYRWCIPWTSRGVRDTMFIFGYGLASRRRNRERCLHSTSGRSFVSMRMFGAGPIQLHEWAASDIQGAVALSCTAPSCGKMLAQKPTQRNLNLAQRYDKSASGAYTRFGGVISQKCRFSHEITAFQQSSAKSISLCNAFLY